MPRVHSTLHWTKRVSYAHLGRPSKDAGAEENHTHRKRGKNWFPSGKWKPALRPLPLLTTFSKMFPAYFSMYVCYYTRLLFYFYTLLLFS